MPKVRIKNLTFAFQKNPILSNVEIEIAAGEFLAIIGPNGGGKTTLLKLLMGFLKPQTGSITLDDKPPEDFRPAIGYVPQHFEFDTSFPISVREVIEMGGTKIDPLLKKLHLTEMQKKPFGALSGGQMQRALLARALASNPKILLLDEATSCVDIETSRIIIQHLEELKGKTTILMVTHELPTIVKSIDRILCVHRNCNFIPLNEVCEHVAHGLYPLPKETK